jgi:hypothetical protein
MRQFIPATSPVTLANHKANLQCQSVALAEAHLATLDRGVSVTHSEIACTTVRTRALLETQKREIFGGSRPSGQFLIVTQVNFARQVYFGRGVSR